MRKVLLFISGLALLAVPTFAIAQVFGQNQIIMPPFGSNGFVVSTTTANGAKLSATSTPYFANFFANIANITKLGNLTTNGLVKTGSSNGTLSIATAGSDYVNGSGTSGNCVRWGASNSLADAGAACGSGTGGAFPFTPTSYGNSTTSVIAFTNGLISVGTTTISGLSTGLVGNSNGLLYGFASSSLFGFTPASNATTITIAGTASQITSSAGAQDLSANRTWTLSLPNHVIFPGNFRVTNSTTTNATTTNLTVTASTTLGSVVNGAGLSSCSGTSALTFTGTQFGCAAQPQGTVTSVTATAPIFSSGGATPNITWAGLATTSQPSSSNLLTSNGGAGVYGTATSTLTPTSPLGGSFTQVGTGGTITCTTAASGVAGCLSNTSFDIFNNKQATISVTWPIKLTGAVISTDFSTTSNSGMSAGNLYVGSGGIFQTSASSSIFGYTPLNPTRNLTIAGTASQITSSAGAQDLSADRTWTLSLPNHVIFPGNFQATNSTTTNATTTTLTITSSTTLSTIVNGGGLTTCTGTSALTYSGTAFSCTAQPQGTVTSVTASYPLASSGGATPNITTLFGTTTAWGMGNNGFVITGPTGIPFVAASSSLSLPNTALQNSTISGVALGSTLAALTATNATLTFSGSYTGTSAQTVGLNLGNGNSWTALQQFGNASTSLLSVYNKAYFGATASTTIDSTGNVVIPSGSNLTVTGKTDGCATFATGVLNSTGSACGGAGSTPGAPVNAIQFNSASTFAGASDFFFNSANGFVGIGGSSTPQLALFTVAASSTGAVNTSIFAVASSSSGTATTTLFSVTPPSGASDILDVQLLAGTNVFSVSSIGSTTLGLFGACSGTSALTTDSSGNIICGAISGTGGASFPFTPTTNYAINTSATSTPIWARLGLMASSTSYFDQLQIGSTTSGTMSTSTNFGNWVTTGNASSTGLTVSGIRSALLLSGAQGSVSAYGGAAGCTNQVVTAISAVGATTCSTVADAMLASTFVKTLTVTTGQGVSGSFSAGATPALSLTLGALTAVTSINGLIITANTGVITTGTWSATAITVAKGGTNNTATPSSMLLAYDNAGTTIQATSTPQAAAFLATSTTATSTFAGAVLVGTTTETSVGITSASQFMAVISNALTSFGGLLINLATNVTNAFTIKGADGTTRLNVDTTTSTSGFLLGSTTIGSNIAQFSDVGLFGNVPLNNAYFQIASSSQGATSTLFLINNVGHVIASSTNPVVTCTGGTLTSYVGDDTHGEAVCGAGSTAIVVTFAATWSAAPICVISNQSMSITSALSYTITTTALTISQAVGLATDKVDFMCQGVKGPQ